MKTIKVWVRVRFRQDTR